MKCAGIAVIGALLCLLTKRQGGEFAVLVSIGAVALVAVLAMTLLKPVLAFGETLRDAAALGTGVTGPVLKTLAIGFVTELGAAICEDAGEKAIAGALKLAGSTAALYVLLPLMESLLALLEKLL